MKPEKVYIEIDELLAHINKHTGKEFAAVGELIDYINAKN